MVYLDTSVAVPLFVREPASDAIAAWFAACAEPLVSADWIVTEFASALSLKQRRGALEGEMAAAAWEEFSSFCGSGLRLVPVSRPAFGAAAQMARQADSGLRAGDSLHLAVAIEVNASAIATADARLADNAEQRGLAIHRF